MAESFKTEIFELDEKSISIMTSATESLPLVLVNTFAHEADFLWKECASLGDSAPPQKRAAIFRTTKRDCQRRLSGFWRSDYFPRSFKYASNSSLFAPGMSLKLASSLPTECTV